MLIKQSTNGGFLKIYKLMTYSFFFFLIGLFAFLVIKQKKVQYDSSFKECQEIEITTSSKNINWLILKKNKFILEVSELYNEKKNEDFSKYLLCVPKNINYENISNLEEKTNSLGQIIFYLNKIIKNNNDKKQTRQIDENEILKVIRTRIIERSISKKEKENFVFSIGIIILIIFFYMLTIFSFSVALSCIITIISTFIQIILFYVFLGISLGVYTILVFFFVLFFCLFNIINNASIMKLHISNNYQTQFSQKEVEKRICKSNYHIIKNTFLNLFCIILCGITLIFTMYYLNQSLYVLLKFFIPISYGLVISSITSVFCFPYIFFFIQEK